ncbi:MAG: c-type cytochrome domain-containing protein, partial [Terriglobia bacterium]
MMTAMVQWKFWGLIAFIGAPAFAQNPSVEFFETQIRPVLADKCYACHSSKLKSPMGGLLLDTKAGLKAGGNGGPVIIAGDPAHSRLLNAL